MKVQSSLFMFSLLSLNDAINILKSCTRERYISLVGVTKVPHTHDVFRRWAQ